MVNPPKSTITNQMAESDAWFITISPSNFDLVDLKVTETLTTCYSEYHAVLEHGSDGTHPHLHIYVKGDKPERQDNVRNRWKRQLAYPATEKRFLTVVKCNDRNQLIGAYLQKEETSEVLWTTITQEELTNLAESYKKINEKKNKKVPSKHLALTGAADKIILYAKGHDLPMDSYREFGAVIHWMYSDGYRMPYILNKMQLVWAEVQMITGRTTDFIDKQM